MLIFLMPPKFLSHTQCIFIFISKVTAPTEIYTLSLHDALPISVCPSQFATRRTLFHVLVGCEKARSEERFSRNAETDLVCRLLLEKKKRNGIMGLQVI